MYTEGYHHNEKNDYQMNNGIEKDSTNHHLKADTSSTLSETVVERREAFSKLLRSCDLRSLASYLEKTATSLKSISNLPDIYRRQFKTAEFRQMPYTWFNPILYLLRKKDVINLVVQELSRRVNSSEQKT